MDIPGGFFFAKGDFENNTAYIFSENRVLSLNVQTKQIDSLDYPLNDKFAFRLSPNQAAVRTDSSFLFYSDGTQTTEYLTCARSNYEDFSIDRHGMFILYKAFDNFVYLLNTEGKESAPLFPYQIEQRL